MVSDRFRSYFRFAFGVENTALRQDIPSHRMEKLGHQLAWFVYGFRKIARTYLCDPRTITVVLTFFFMVLAALLFYPSDTWDIIVRSFNFILDHIEWRYLRFGLWMISEITILGLGMRAFGRFSNSQLMKLHGII